MPLWSRKGKDWLCHSTISNSGEPYEAKVSRTDRRGEGAARLLPTPADSQSLTVPGVCRSSSSRFWVLTLRLRSGPFEGPAIVKPPALPEDTYVCRACSNARRVQVPLPT